MVLIFGGRGEIPGLGVSSLGLTQCMSSLGCSLLAEEGVGVVFSDALVPPQVKAFVTEDIPL